MLSVRHNIMQIGSVRSFASIRGSIRQECKDVYFVRALGISDAVLQEIREMDRTLSAQMQEGKSFYKRISALPRLTRPEDISFCQSRYDAWHSGGRVLLETRTVTDDTAARMLSLAFRQTLRVFSDGKNGVSASIERNFAVKMIAWVDALLGSMTPRWSPAASCKIVAENIVKTQEYLFFYMLTLFGCDVLLLQSRSDIPAGEPGSALSCSFHVGGFSDQLLPSFVPYTPEPARSSAPAVPARPMPAQPSVTAASMPGRPVDISRPDRVKRRTAAASRPERTEHPASVHAEISTQRTEKSFESLAQLASSVVMIAVCDARGQVKGSGSGIMVGRDGYILTNFHVVRGGGMYAVRIEEDEEIYTTNELIKYNAMLDLAIIRIQRKLCPIPVYRGNQKLVRGQRVVAIGSPMGLFNSVSDGIIAGFRTLHDVDMIQFTAPISHGSSGGAVLNMYGEIIGISTAGIDEGQNLNLAVGYSYINEFIRGFV